MRSKNRTVLGMLNQAAQKVIFALEKNYIGFENEESQCLIVAE